MTYDNNCLTGVKHALEFNPFYSSGNGSTTPYFENIVVDGLKAVSSASSAQSVLQGYNSSHLLGLTLEKVTRVCSGAGGGKAEGPGLSVVCGLRSLQRWAISRNGESP